MSNPIMQAITELMHAFPRQNVTPDTVKVYYKHLRDLPEPAVLAAVNQAIETGTFFPSIGELRGIIAEHANGADDLAETAWLEVQTEIRRVGYQPRTVFRGGEFIEPPQPRFSTERIREAVASIGWQRLCQGEPGEIRKEFIFTYRNLRKRDVNRVHRGDFGAFTTALGDGDAALDKGGAA